MLIILTILLICIISASGSFKAQNILKSNYGYVKMYDNFIVKIIQVCSYIILPVIILFRLFSWWQAILYIGAGFLLSEFISVLIVKTLIKTKYVHLLLLTGMIIGVIGALTILFSNSQFNDGYYCARVNYYNPRTETKSEYRLTVSVEDNKVISIEFHNGGWLDESHFEAPKLNFNGEAKFTTDRNNVYKIKILEKDECEYEEDDDD
jgi:hypothetical protein